MRATLRRASVIWLAAACCGCMANRTRMLPVTPVVPEKAAVPAALENRRVAVFLEFRSAKVSGGHHEGRLQGRQPSGYGLSRDQRKGLYGNAPQAAALSFTAELRRQGVDAYWSDGAAAGRDAQDRRLFGRVDRVALNTYGGGTKEGFGSAGDYWEASLDLVLSLRQGEDGAVVWEGPLSSYAKLDPCPVRWEWSLWGLFLRSMEDSLSELAKTSAPKGLAAVMAGGSSAWENAYRVDPAEVTPIEVAARHAAVEFLRVLGGLSGDSPKVLK
ncbi:MAG: hypothetical protein HY748_18120 [Elusimicrobia bacterium]|nr:hypothetical protein [Elusimicrobiota bacterium]